MTRPPSAKSWSKSARSPLLHLDLEHAFRVDRRKRLFIGLLAEAPMIAITDCGADREVASETSASLRLAGRVGSLKLASTPRASLSSQGSIIERSALEASSLVLR